MSCLDARFRRAGALEEVGLDPVECPEEVLPDPGTVFERVALVLIRVISWPEHGFGGERRVIGGLQAVSGHVPTNDR
jgi:hypothetical protein